MNLRAAAMEAAAKAEKGKDDGIEDAYDPDQDIVSTGIDNDTTPINPSSEDQELGPDLQTLIEEEARLQAEKAALGSIDHSSSMTYSGADTSEDKAESGFVMSGAETVEDLEKMLGIDSDPSTSASNSGHDSTPSAPENHFDDATASPTEDPASSPTEDPASGASEESESRESLFKNTTSALGKNFNSMIAAQQDELKQKANSAQAVGLAGLIAGVFSGAGNAVTQNKLNLQNRMAAKRCTELASKLSDLEASIGNLNSCVSGINNALSDPTRVQGTTKVMNSLEKYGYDPARGNFIEAYRKAAEAGDVAVIKEVRDYFDNLPDDLKDSFQKMAELQEKVQTDTMEVRAKMDEVKLSPGLIDQEFLNTIQNDITNNLGGIQNPIVDNPVNSEDLGKRMEELGKSFQESIKNFIDGIKALFGLRR